MIHNNLASQTFRKLGLALLLVVPALTAPAPNSAQVAGTAAITIHNFGKVSESYYRGAQPGKEEFDQLKRLGIKTIIDLRQDKDAKEGEWVSRAGMQYFNIPLKASRAADDEQTSYFLSLVNNPANLPVYVHCKGGRHRTGALTAVYRITHDGWNADQAFQEMKRYDFNHGFFGGPSAQKKYVFAFYKRYAANHSQR
jgi:tyrosine-protein phosphatase SIW14